MNINHKVPVTVLTGYLGAGKTSLLNTILTQTHGKKIAVIVNEFGEISIDHDLIISSDEEIFQMSNGCVCCNVRGDLIRVLNGLLRREGAFDAILIEATGLADPAPVAQTFFTDPEIAEKAQLDAVITMVDAKHIEQQLKASPEVERQISFADVVVLNKIDLLKEGERRSMRQLLRSLNPMSHLIDAVRGEVDLKKIMNVGAFDLERVAERMPQAHAEVHKHDHDESCSCSKCQHGSETDVAIQHNSNIKTLSFSTDKMIDGEKILEWLGTLVAKDGENLLRYKGIFNVKGEKEPVVVQGVHMMLEGSTLSAWPKDQAKESRLVFIGTNLNEQDLQKEFAACYVV